MSLSLRRKLTFILSGIVSDDHQVHLVACYPMGTPGENRSTETYGGRKGRLYRVVRFDDLVDCVYVAECVVRIQTNNLTTSWGPIVNPECPWDSTLKQQKITKEQFANFNSV